VEQRFPALRRGKKDGKEHGAHCTYHGVEKGSEGESIVGSLKFLDSLMEIDDTVE
jgi:hypothetical protein